MSEQLLEAILEKIESFELLLKVTDNGKEEIQQIKSELTLLRKEIKNLPTQLQLDTGKLNEVVSAINKLQLQLNIPIKNQVEHKHHLHNGIWVAVGLFVTCFLLAWGWLNAHREKEQFEANDMKYRSLKTSGNKNVLNLCKYTDSLYQKDRVGFSNRVEQEEQRLIEQAELLRLAGEKEKEAKTLKEQAGSSIRKP
ncbi:hypothetical protein [Sediminibacterium sp.]|uniref:hypothetical protein n=1 Tax=Sediminibacterium sp. TaxID=1917865 RepID=UPI0025F1ED88|nr:hypothetical protein [Sediminibacterium sp.]